MNLARIFCLVILCLATAMACGGPATVKSQAALKRAYWGLPQDGLGADVTGRLSCPNGFPCDAFANPAKVEAILRQGGFRDIALTPIDAMQPLGTVDAAVLRLTQFGPAAQPLREATATQRQQALLAMHAALQAHHTAAGVQLAAACWLV